jgi:uncharacterized membrane protein
MRAVLGTKEKPPAETGGASLARNLTLAALLAGFVLPALAALLSALTGLLLLLAGLLLAAAALLLAGLVLTTLLLAGILLVRIVHDRSYLYLSLYFPAMNNATTLQSLLQITL